LRLLDRAANYLLLIGLGIITRLPRQSDTTAFRVPIVAVISFAATVYESGTFQVAHQFPDLSGHSLAPCEYGEWAVTPIFMVSEVQVAVKGWMARIANRTTTLTRGGRL